MRDREGGNVELSTMTRRSFVQLSAFAGAAAAVGISAHSILPTKKAYADDDEVVEQRTCCYQCPRACAVIATIRNGVVERLAGCDEDYMTKGSMCAKGLCAPQALYHPNRTKYPMKRVGERGVDNTWERISWDEAIDLVADALNNLANKTGRNGLLTTCGGGGVPKFADALGMMYYFGGGNSFEPGAAQCSMPRTFIQCSMLGPFRSAGIGDFQGINMFNPYKPSPCAVLWGTGPASHCPTQVGRYFTRIRELGTKLIVVDPRFSPDAARADVWLPVRAGTDVCMLNAWIKWLIDNDKYDHDFVVRWSNGPFLVNPNDNNLTLLRASEVEGIDLPNGETYVYFDEKTQSVTRTFALSPENEADYKPALEGYYDVRLKDGTTIKCKTGFTALREFVEEFTLERAAEVCHSPLEKIEEALEIFGNAGEGRSLAGGVSVDQYLNSAESSMGLAILNILVGSTYKPGSGCLSNAQYDSSKARYTFGKEKGRFSNMGNHERGRFNPNIDREGNIKRFEFDAQGNPRPLAEDGLPEPFEYYNAQAAHERIGYVEHKGLGYWGQCLNGEVSEAMATGDPYPVKVWTEITGNKLAMTGGAAGWIKGAKNLDFCVHHHMYPTAFTFEFADLLMPTAEWLEQSYTAKDHGPLHGYHVACTRLFEHVDYRFIYGTYFKKLADKYHDERAYHVIYDDDEYYTIYDLDEYLEDMSWTDNVAGKKLTWEETKAIGFYAECSEEELWTYNEREYYKNETVDKDGYYFGFKKGNDGAPLDFRDIKELPRKQDLFADFFVWCGRKGNDPWGDMEPASEEYNPLPTYREPSDSDNAETAAKYPLFLSQGRIPYYHHGTLRNNPFLRELYPAPEVWIDPQAAAERGIETGDWVNIKSPRCEEYEEIVDGIYGVAWVTNGIARGCVFMERFWNPEFLEDGKDARKSWTTSNVNVLTPRKGPYNPIVGSMTYRGIGVEITKASRPEGVWYDAKDFEPWMPEPSENTGGGYIR